MQINSAKELKVYQEAYSLAMEVFETSKTWPGEVKIFPDRSGKALVSLGMCQFARGMGKAKI